MPATAASINRFLAGSPMAGLGQMMVNTAAKYGISDPGVFAVLARKESSLGRQNFAPFNPYGWSVHLPRSTASFANYAASTEKVARELTGSLYKGSGLRTLPEVIGKWAPPSE